MDSQTISLVRTTFKAVAAVADGPEALTSSFYAILFSDYPAARDFFPADMKTQRDRLVRALAYVVDRLEEQETLLPFLAQLGRDHRKYGTRPEHYEAVGNSLIKALRTFAGTELWTDDVDRAWTTAINVIAATMIGAAATETTPAVWAATVVSHTRVLQNLAVVRLRLDQPMRYRAGQYVSVQVPARPRMWRYLSPANPANDEGVVEFHIRSVPGGWVSPAMVNGTHAGDVWHLGSPLGSLGVPQDSGKDLVLIGCGTGIAPLRAQVLELAEWTTHRRVHLFCGGHYPCDLYAYEELRRLALRHPWLTVTPVVEKDESPWWFVGDPGLHDRPFVGQIGKIVASLGDWEGHDVQIAGAPAMVQTTKFRMMAAGTPVRAIRHDPLL